MADTPQKVAIITGAGSGVGRALAVLMAEVGYAVVLAARTKAKLEDTAQLARGEVGDEAEVLVVPTDVTDEAAVQRLVDAAVEKFGRVDAAANCAGNAPLQPIPRIDTGVLRGTFASNLFSVVYMTRALWPIFKKQKAGTVCNVSSMSSVDPFKGFNIYGAAKAGVNLFTKATADEGERIGVKAFAVAPGAIETPMLRENFSTKAIPASACMDPAEVAGVIRDLLTGKHDAKPGETVMLPSPH